MRKFRIPQMITLILLTSFMLTSFATAVTTQVTRHSSPATLLEGETENVVINSQGQIQLAREFSSVSLDGLLDNVWIINAIAEDSKGNVFLGTSPNGVIIQVDAGDEAKVIYPAASEPADIDNTDADGAAADADATSEMDANMFSNLHIFAVAVDSSDNLIAAVSGPEPKLLRFVDGKVETIYEPDEALYILDIAVDASGNIYLATGPEGMVIRLESDGSNPTMIFDAQDNNILSIAVGPDGFVYAGSDERGIVYKINPDLKTASVLFDSEQSEITSLMFDAKGNLYAAATSAQAGANQENFSAISAGMAPGKPEAGVGSEQPTNDSPARTDEQLTTPNTETSSQQQQKAAQQQAERGEMPKTAGHIYKIDPRGFVTTIFQEMAVFFSLEQQDGKILLGTGNKAELFTIDPATEQKEVAYADETSSQITALQVSGDSVYIAAANPAQLIKLEKTYFTSGTYSSQLVDAEQPARWGKLQVDARLPGPTAINMRARTGNVADADDPSFSPWTEQKPVTGPTDMVVPLGRHLQYRLELTTDDPTVTPVVHEVVIPSVVPNLAPKVHAVTVGQAKNKPIGIFEVVAHPSDANGDALAFTYQFRQIGRANWITFAEDQAQPKVEWNTRTVEDGRYEIRVVASDRKSNTPTTAMEGARVSDVFVVDNSAPVVDEYNLTTQGNVAKLAMTVSDNFSLVGQIRYTVDSGDDFAGTLPNDLVYDTTTESFTIVIPELSAGPHVIAVELRDDLGNKAYKSFEIHVEQ